MERTAKRGFLSMEIKGSFPDTEIYIYIEAIMSMPLTTLVITTQAIF